jgi:hypothetical protein
MIDTYNADLEKIQGPDPCDNRDLEMQSLGNIIIADKQAWIFFLATQEIMLYRVFTDHGEILFNLISDGDEHDALEMVEEILLFYGYKEN